MKLEFDSRRSQVSGRKGMVAASQPLAVAAGLACLAEGGCAADAAVSAAAALAVLEPVSTGIGGDCFALYYESDSGRISALNGSGRAPEALSIARIKKEGFASLPPGHPYNITVPGAAAAWSDLLARHGRRSLASVLAPAVKLAEEGFPVAPLTSFFWERGVEEQLRFALGGEELTLGGRAPRAGEIFRNPGLAAALNEIAIGGKEAFYQGDIAHSIVETVRKAGGCLALDDLARHESTWVTPISTTYRDWRIWECPPNGQGLAALLTLNILEGFDIKSLPPLSGERMHLIIESLRLAFADARWHVADPETHPAPLMELLSKEYASRRRGLIDRKQANLHHGQGIPPSSSDTVYLSVVDGQGNACSLINSNYQGFGTGIVPAGWGFPLQNRGHNFSLEENHPNALAPGKRPYHTIIPALATRPDENGREQLLASFGVMGGFMQPQGHVQVLLALIDDGLDPQAALDRLRICIEDGRASGRVALEEGISEETGRDLASRGHEWRMVRGYDRALFGRGQIILRDPANGVLVAGSDPRADGLAMTL